MAGGASPGLMLPGQLNGMDLKKGSSCMVGEGRDFLRSVGTPKADPKRRHGLKQWWV